MKGVCLGPQVNMLLMVYLRILMDQTKMTVGIIPPGSPTAGTEKCAEFIVWQEWGEDL